MTELRGNLAIDFLISLFENGVETYNFRTREPINLGGARLWRHNDPLGEDSSINFLSSDLREFVKAYSDLSLYTTSKAILSSDGTPVMYKDKPKRGHNCLMFYTNVDNATEISEDLIRLFPELADRIITGIGMEEQTLFRFPIDLEKYLVKTEWGTKVPMNYQNTIWLAVHSATRHNRDTGYWTNRSRNSFSLSYDDV